MTERPILFSAPMVLALLAGTKTQTRRIAKVHTGDLFDVRSCVGAVQEWVPDIDPIAGIVGKTSRLIRCPYGVPGDVLWVREGFRREADPCAAGRGVAIWYMADGEPVRGEWTAPKPSIHMPRWASRISLRITDVRVERLQDITAADALAEGVWPGEQPPESFDRVYSPSMPVHLYGGLWEHINGPGSWDANPWVWAVSFERIT